MSAVNKQQDSSLRKHLGYQHLMPQFLYDSQKGGYEAMNKKKKVLDDAAIKAIILDSRPFGDFRRLGMQHFLGVALPGYKGPHRTTVRTNMDPMYTKYCKDLKRYLEKVTSVSLTCDIWTTDGVCFICVTVHFFDNFFNYQSFVIGFRELKG